MEVYLERGSKRVFAGALDWPGWSRSGKTDEEALQALLAYAPRYAEAIRDAHVGFQPPSDGSALHVTEGLTGNATTDFGAPGIPPRADARPVNAAELRKMRGVLRAAWRTLDRAAMAARGKTLRTGPRGGGRSLSGIVQHVDEAEEMYLRAPAAGCPRRCGTRRAA